MSREPSGDVIDNIRTVAKRYFMNAHTSHDWSHVQRVLQMCMLIGEKEGANLSILKLAALLHDIARHEEDLSKGQICHGQRGAELAEEILRQYGIDEEIIREVTHCILSHRFRNQKLATSKEAKVLFDADNLDAVGAIGIARSFAFAGENNLKLYTKEHLTLKKAPAALIDYNKHTPVLEFKSKLLRVIDAIQTKTGREIAKKRHNFLLEFLAQFEKEVQSRL
ncbi:MAG: HD domain-containing protein [Candidatus Heimdallarchaeota archaeon]